MKEKLYTLECMDCSQELSEGTYREIKKDVKDMYRDWEDVDEECADEGILYLHCNDCQRMLS